MQATPKQKKIAIAIVAGIIFFLLVILPIISLLLFGASYVPILSEIAVVFVTLLFIGIVTAIGIGIWKLYEMITYILANGF